MKLFGLSKGMKYTIYFLMLFFLGWNSILFWLISFFLPIVLWGKYFSDKLSKNFPRRVISIIKIYGIFCSLVIIRGIFSSDPLIPITRAVTIITIIITLLCFFVNVNNIERLKDMMKGIVLAIDILLIYCYIVHFNGLTFDLEYGDNIIGNKNTVGNYLFLGVVSNVLLLYCEKTKSVFLFYLNLFFFLVSSLVTMSFKIMLVSAVSAFMLFFLGIPKKKKLVLIVLSAIPIGCLIPFIEEFFDSKVGGIIRDRFYILIGKEELAETKLGYLDTRHDLIEQTFNLFTENPLFGTGLEVSRNIFGTYSHNTFVEILAGGGIVLFFSFVSLLLLIWFPIWRKKDYLIITIFGLVIFIANGIKIYDTFSIVLILFMLLYFSYYSEEKNMFLGKYEN